MPTRTRSPSPEASTSKRPRIEHNLIPDAPTYFASGLLKTSNADRLGQEYRQSAPFKYCVVDQLFQDDLLRKVKDEIIKELHFTEKETDIYKIHQTGDLASLSYLPESQLALLQNLQKLRDALYSPSFREFLRGVTGCGHLSGSKQDMSINSYRTGCHLLNHDDVIGSRRVSYILYMPLPVDKPWQPEWGGALELYPVVHTAPEPAAIPSKKIPPSWNQFIFFEVQPGASYHSVEEVVVGSDDGTERLSISGWFHKPQEGEEGYEAEDVSSTKSSLQQLTSSEPVPFQVYPDSIPIPVYEPGSPLPAEYTTFLSEYLSPTYLSPASLSMMAQRFVNESSIQLHSILQDDIAKALEAELRRRDEEDHLGSPDSRRIHPHTSGLANNWEVRGPPHKSRFCVLSGDGPTNSPESILWRLQEHLFPSPAFRAWLAAVSSLVPLSHSVIARRFRPGLDYTLAVAEESEARLDIVLSLTPRSVTEEMTDAGDSWPGGEYGGWECYMAPHDGDEDPAVYRSSSSTKQHTPAKNESAEAPSTKKDGEEADGDDDMEDGDDDDEDGALLMVQPAYNRLLIVLRDEGVMRFVKYVSAAAPGSRYDIWGEFAVGAIEEEEDEDGEGEGDDE